MDALITAVLTVVFAVLALLLNPLTILVVACVNPILASGLLVVALACGLIGALTGVFAGVLAKWIS